MQPSNHATMKVAFFELNDWEKEPLLRAARDLKAVVFKEKVDEIVDRAKDFEIISPFIYSDLSGKTLKQLPNLKLIATRSTGFDHIDIKYCRSCLAADRQAGILVANVPSYGENTVAEHTFALILALTRRIVEANERVRQGSLSPLGLTGVDLKDKTLGIIGLGHIGLYVLKIAKGFGMNVLVNTRSQNPALAKGLNFEYVDLKDLLCRSDITTIHVPLAKETTHLINKKNIKLMKKGSFLINTSRGPIVETEAILWALQNGILAGAGLDVLEEEELIDDPLALLSKPITKDELKDIAIIHLLREMTNVIITPHNAFNTKEAINRIIATTKNNIERYLAGQATNLITK